MNDKLPGWTKFAARSAFYYAGRHRLLFIVSALVCGVLLAGLAAGDSLKKTLRTRAHNAVGQISYTISSPEGTLPDDIAANGAAVMRMGASLYFNGVSRHVNLNGVGADFFRLAPAPFNLKFNANEAAVNPALARELGLKIGDEIGVVFFSGSGIPVDSPFSNYDGRGATAALKVVKILDAQEFGDFSFEVSQAPPLNIFCSLDFLQEKTGLQGRGTEVLINVPKGRGPNLRNFTPNDFNLKIFDGIVKSPSWFLPRFISGDSFSAGEKSLAWFADELRSAKGASPYGFVLGMGREVAINEILAVQLEVSAGDSITVGYYAADAAGGLTKKSASLTIDKIITAQQALELRKFMPEFEGLTNAAACDDWRSRLPIDFSKITEDDRGYWERYKYAPKLIVPYDVARKLWGGPLGDATALAINSETEFVDLIAALSPAEAGLVIQSPSNPMFEDASDGTDFGGLFIGLSFFIIAACLILALLAAKSAIHSRREEAVLYRFLGYSKLGVYLGYFREMMLPVLAGIAAGVPLGIVLSGVVLFSINGIWASVAPGAGMMFALRPASVLAAMAIAIVFCACALAFSVRNALKFTADGGRPKTSKPAAALLFAGIFILVFVLQFFIPASQIAIRAALSALLLACGLLAYYNFCGMAKSRRRLPGVFGFALLYMFRRRDMFSAAALSAIASLMLAGVGLNAFNEPDLAQPSSPAGGYQWYIETALPLGSASGAGFNFLPLMVHDAAEANCLNLSRVTRPRVLGADPSVLSARGAFKFLAQGPVSEDWASLETELPAGEIPVVADSASLMWSMKKRVGDVLEYDSPTGSWKFRIVAALEPSILQGSILISEKNFREVWPQAQGYRLFLADDDGEGGAALAGYFRKYHPAIQTTKGRLASFNALQNSYLKIFLQLGLLGCVIGLAGTGVLAASGVRNLGAEHAALAASGWSSKTLADVTALAFALAAMFGGIIGGLSACPVLPSLHRCLFALSAGPLFFLAAYAFARWATFKMLKNVRIKEEV